MRKMPRLTQSFDDAIREAAAQKTRAARSRFDGAPVGGESAAEAYQDVCSSIADVLANDGFRFSKSGPHLSRKAGSIVHRIAFQTSSNNIAGEFVSLSIFVNVRSPSLKKWRSTNTVLNSDSDMIAGGQIGNLLKTSVWMEWNVADRSLRSEDVRDAEQVIREIALPYFAAFESPSVLSVLVLRDKIVVTHWNHLLDYLVCFDSKAKARSVALYLFASRPDLHEDYNRRLGEFQLSGTPRRASSAYSETLAAASIIYEFGDLSRR
jgi:hypothetical protein